MTGNLSGIPAAEKPVVETPTPEQIERHYSACMDSVNLINAGKPELMSDADWADTVERNKEHLKIMVAKDFWAGHDLSPINAVIES